MNMHVASLNAAGVDIGRDYLDFAIAPTGLVKRFPNTEGGVAKLLATLAKHQVKTLVIEAIGPYSYPLLRALRGRDLAVGVVNPQRIRAWRTAEGKRAKNDRLDAQAIARFAQKMPDVYRPIPDEASLKIKAVSARRRQIVEMIAMEKTRLKQAFDDELLDSSRKMIALLEAQRDAVEARLNALLREAGRGDMLALLQTAPGVGPKVAATLAADMPELGRIGRRAAASLAGLAPHIQQSGIDRGRASISGGRPCVRAALYMAALVASRSNPRIKAEYRAMRDAGKPAKVAFIAIARKLLVVLNQMVAEQTPWTQQQKRIAED
jgi:transposase